MTLPRPLAVCLPLLVCASTALSARPTTAPAASERLDRIAAHAVARAKQQVPDANLQDEQISVTVIDLSDPGRPALGQFRGDAGVYPASVVKLFYLAAARQWIHDGKLQETDELKHGLSDMIIDSSNEATQYVVDAVTDAQNGADLPPAEMERWTEKRNAVNRYFTSLGYAGINVCQKTYGEGPYGRERIFLGPKYENRNKLTTNATARLLAEVAAGRAVSEEDSGKMMGLLRRDMAAKKNGGEDQAHDFSALALDVGKDRMWSKAGWTSTARHDAAYVETGDGLKVVVTTFTTGQAKQKQIIPAVVGSVLADLRKRE